MPFLAAESNFEPVLRRRLNLFGLDSDDLRHLHFRHDRDREFFNNRLLELSGIRDVLERVPQDDKIYVGRFNKGRFSRLLFRTESTMIISSVMPFVRCTPAASRKWNTSSGISIKSSKREALKLCDAKTARDHRTKQFATLSAAASPPSRSPHSRYF